MSLRWYGHDGVSIHEDTFEYGDTHGYTTLKEDALLKENVLLKDKIKQLEKTVRNYVLYVPFELVTMLSVKS